MPRQSVNFKGLSPRTRSGSANLETDWAAYGATACLVVPCNLLKDQLEAALESVNLMHRRAQDARDLSEAVERFQNSRVQADAEVKQSEETSAESESNASSPSTTTTAAAMQKRSSQEPEGTAGGEAVTVDI